MQERRNQIDAWRRFRAISVPTAATFSSHGMEDRKYRKRAKVDIARLNGLWLCAPPTLNTEAVKNYPGGVGSIECVKVNDGNVVIQKIVALFQCEVNTDAPDHFRIVLASL